MSRDQADLSPATLRRDRIWAVVTVGAGAPADPPPGVVVLSDTDFQERHLGRIDATVAAGFEAGPVASLGKRLFDVIMSLLLLALALPLMAFTAMAIACDSPGPVLYRQTRIGLAGRPFMLLKFRSMTTDAEAGGQPRWAQKHDPRVTRVGRFIRQTRIDELPQLLNVLRGDMSLVGPRPERPHFVGELAREIPGYETRTRVKPGITGWAQVNYPYGASVEDAREKHAYDLYYLKHRGFLLDLLILFGTVRVILFGEGAR